MMRIVLLFFLVIAFGVWTYHVKHDAEESSRILSDLRFAIEQQKTKIILLEADWALLTSPSRLSILSRSFSDISGLRESAVLQTMDIDSLPHLLPDFAPSSDSVSDLIHSSQAN